jgi:menaquinone-dependent protoporphyrinogen IX oxidase
MKKTIVVYYSRTGNNKFLAEKISKTLNCEIVAIQPRMNLFLLQMLSKNGGGIKPLSVNLEEYQNVILCGPIWMGKFVAPLRGFVQKYGNQISRLNFATCCASGDEMKNEKFGHGIVFQKIKELLGDKCQHCEAFPVGLVAEGAEKKTSDTLMKIRLSDANFIGEIQKRLDGFIRLVNEG